MPEFVEQRKFVRIRISNSVKHVKFNLGGNVVDTPVSLTKDLSAGGVLFESTRIYEIGDIIRLEIDVPGWEKFKPEFYKPHLSKSEPVIVLVKVVRVVFKDIDVYDIAASFVGIDDGHQMALAKYIKSVVAADDSEKR